MARRKPFYLLVAALSAAGLMIALISGILAAGMLNPTAPWLVWGIFVSGLAASALALRRAAPRLAKGVSRLPKRAQSMLYNAGLLLIFLTGLLLRLHVQRMFPIAPDSDYAAYYQLGKHLAEGTLLSDGGVYREYVAKFPHTLGFPLLVLKTVFSVWGASVPAALYANLAFCLLNILLTASLGRLLRGRACGLTAGALMAVWPSYVVYSGLVASEPSFTFFVLLALRAAFSYFPEREESLSRRPTLAAMGVFGVAGALLALAGAIRPMAVIVVIALVLALAIRLLQEANAGRKERRRAMMRRVLCAVALLTIYGTGGALLDSRVQAEIGLPVPGMGDNFGYSLMVGVNVESRGYWNEGDEAFLGEAYAESGSAAGAHRASLEVAYDRIREDPAGVVMLAAEKYIALWQGDDFGVDWVLLFSGRQGILTPERAAWLQAARVAGRFLYLLTLLLSLLLLPEAVRRPRGEYAALLLFYLGTAALHMVLETQVRYHYTVIPVFILLSSVSVFADRCAAYRPWRG